MLSAIPANIRLDGDVLKMLSSRRTNSHIHSKSGKKKYFDYVLQFSKKQNLCTKINSRKPEKISDIVFEKAKGRDGTVKRTSFYAEAAVQRAASDYSSINTRQLNIGK